MRERLNSHSVNINNLKPFVKILFRLIKINFLDNIVGFLEFLILFLR